MSKNPYELRYDVIELARNHLTTEYQAAYERAFHAPDRKREAAMAALSYPTMEEILQVAARLKNFVDGGPVISVENNPTAGRATFIGDLPEFKSSE